MNETNNTEFQASVPWRAQEIIGVADQVKENSFVWEDIKPLPDELKPVAAFDFNILPESLIPWAKDICSRAQCPPDYPAIGIMVALSAVIGRKVGIHPKAKDDWLVIPNLWGMAVGPPSAMKTPALTQAMKPLERLEIEAKDGFIKENSKYETDKELYALEKKETKKSASEALSNNNRKEAERLLHSSNEPTKPTRKRHLINDPTVEKLGEILNENPNGILLFRDELTGWFKSLDREESSNDRAFYLEAFNGSGRYTYDRIGRGTIDIEAVTVSIVGGIQPSKLIPYVRSSVHGGAQNDGLIQRMQLAVYPDIVKRWEYVDTYPDSKAKQSVFDLFSRLEKADIAIGKSDYSDIPGLRFSTEAQGMFVIWLTKLEDELRSGELHPAVEAHLTKYRSLVPSLALIIELAENADANEVSEVALLKAVEWGDYLRTHAERIYGLAVNNEIHSAKTVINKIKQGKLPSPFTARDVTRKQWAGLTEPGNAEKSLQLLIDEGYLQVVEIETGGRPKVEHFIHPDLLKKAEGAAGNG